TNKIYLNPALTGHDGGTSFSSNYRNQWFFIAGNMAQFTTNSFALDVEMPCVQSSMGLLYLDNQEGEGYLRWQSLGLSWAWRPKESRYRNSEVWDFSLGLKGSYNWRSLDWNNLVFSDQLDAIRGNIGPSAIPNQPANGMSFSRAFDLDFGATFSYKSKLGQSRVGLTVNHLIHVDQSILELEDTLARRYTIDLSHTINVNNVARKYYIVPMFKMDVQRSSFGVRDSNRFLNGVFNGESRRKGIHYLSFQMGTIFSLQDSPGLWGGVWLRSRVFDDFSFNTSSLVTSIGVAFKDRSRSDNSYRFGLSYDFDFFGIRSEGGGAVEASLVINFRDATLFNCNTGRRRSMINPCPF
ncbi:MAG: PorP/SprF family type IX secretion system membrane protein, partial [Bacteroidota bacterium]